ncbi:MAG: Asp-tRNA(Asn)/Glu-tRNA(Gln) amidotransferase subunit GatB [Deltaproteobacteria bacterium]|nr:MAG: Asp-tRNA(Asn)/Glu-tRNA(Gln) amidotransferase subunit GatB [Deltaproteobacteria bacterium]
MKITVQEVEYVARLARLRLSDEEKEVFTGQLNTILEYMDKLNELDTSGVEPTFYVVPHHNAFREDEVRAPMDREEIMANAPSRKGDFFRVPRII